MDRLSTSLSAIRALGPFKLYFDVSPLLETEWTGIPLVAANLANVLLKAAPDEVAFFNRGWIAPTSAVREALHRFGGSRLRAELDTAASLEALDPFDPGRVGVGVFPTVKPVSGVFDVECSIVHDISTVVTPQFHVGPNIDLHAQTIARDLDTNAVTFCVSEATRDDVAAYLGYPADRLVVALNGVSWPAAFEVRADSEFDPDEVESYILVLGTLEPRKNLSLVFDLLANHPRLLDSYRFVFTGRTGWLQDETTPEPLAEAFATGRLLFTGFVSEYQKYKLLRGARALIYPSLLEGFGLPILESLSVGTPCITSRSSSLPEVGGDLCFYFDPFSVKDLRAAVQQFQAVRTTELHALRQRCRDRAAEFTWERMAATLLDGLAPAVAAAQTARLAAGGNALPQAAMADVTGDIG